MATYFSNLYIDVSEVVTLANDLSKKLSPEQGREMLRRTVWDTGKHVKTILKEDVPKEYEVSAGWVGKHVGPPRAGGGGGEISVVIPLKGARGSIGGTFPAGGGAHKVQATQVHMKDGTVRSRKAYWRVSRVHAHIVRGSSSVLPERMSHQGGNPPFLAGGVGFTRTTPKRLPIAHVVGLALPQMPLNRAEDEVREDIEKYMEKRLMHHFSFLLGG